MSVHPAPPGPVANGRRRCRRRPIAAGSPRPSELLRLFFLTGLLFIAASALAGIADAAAGTDWLHWLALHLLLLGTLLRLPSSVLTLTVVALLSIRLIVLAARALGPQRTAGR